MVNNYNYNNNNNNSDTNNIYGNDISNALDEIMTMDEIEIKKMRESDRIICFLNFFIAMFQFDICWVIKFTKKKKKKR
jgi:hypothetical protein